jgi:hypothetical protein
LGSAELAEVLVRADQPFSESSDPDIMESRSGGGFLSIFGIPFLLAGLFLMQAPLGLLRVKTEGGPPAALLVGLFGLPFAAIGAALVFGRSGVILDRQRGTLVRWWGLLVPMKRTEQSLDGFETVRLGYTPGDSKHAATYPVTLVPGDGGRPVPMQAPTDYAAARRLAERLARFLRKPVEDSSAGEKTVRDPDRLDECLRDRIRRTGEDARSLPPRPDGMRTRIEETGDGLVLEIPAAAASRALQALPLVVGLVFFVIVGRNFFSAFLGVDSPPGVRLGIVGVVLLLFLGGPIALVLRGFRGRQRTTRVTVTRDLLRVEGEAAGRTGVAEIPAAELEDLLAPTPRSLVAETGSRDARTPRLVDDSGTLRMPDGRPAPRILLSIIKLVGSPGITARSDTTVVTFGRGLPEQETAYLHAVIRKTIAG